MKLRKTRIKKIEKANGSVEYVAQYKDWFWYVDFEDLFIGDNPHYLIWK